MKYNKTKQNTKGEIHIKKLILILTMAAVLMAGCTYNPASVNNDGKAPTTSEEPSKSPEVSPDTTDMEAGSGNNTAEPNEEQAFELTIENAKVEHDKHDIQYPKVNGMTDKGLQDKINQLLYDSISPLLLEEGEGYELTTIWADYEVQRFDRDLLSVVFNASSYMEGAAHPYNFLIAANINLKTGESISLKQLFPDSYDYKSMLAEKAQPLIDSMEYPLLDEYEGIEENQEFYLTTDQLVIFYQTYVYTPYALGPLKLNFNYSDLDQLLMP